MQGTLKVQEMGRPATGLKHQTEGMAGEQPGEEGLGREAAQPLTSCTGCVTWAGR